MWTIREKENDHLSNLTPAGKIGEDFLKRWNLIWRLKDE